MRRLERLLEKVIFASRWLLAPFYLGLVAGILMLMIKFGQLLAHLVVNITRLDEGETVIEVLALVDVSLAASLVLIVVFAGYENFVSKIDTASARERPDWMGKVDYASLKIKLLSSIVAISAINLLRAFIKVEEFTDAQLGWLVGIHLTFIVSGVLLALMEYINRQTPRD